MKRHTRKRFLLYGALALLVVVFAGGIYWCAKTAVANIEAQDKATAQTQEDARAIAEASRKKKAAELEKRQQEAAKQAAEAAKTGTASSADGASCNTSTSHNDPSRIDVLVNKKHCIQPLQFAPSDLITVQGATLSAKAAEAYVALFNAAAQAGQPFYVTSSYRSYATQITTYNYWVAQSGPAGADTYSARPGYSEHQTGLVIDVAAGVVRLIALVAPRSTNGFNSTPTNMGLFSGIIVEAKRSLAIRPKNGTIDTSVKQRPRT